MRSQCYLCFGLEIEPFLLILGFVFPLVSRFRLLPPSSGSGSYEISSLLLLNPLASVIVLSLLPLVTNLVLELQKK